MIGDVEHKIPFRSRIPEIIAAQGLAPEVTPYEQKSPSEVRQIKTKCEAIVSGVGNPWGIPHIIWKKDSGWSWDFRSHTTTLDENDVYRYDHPDAPAGLSLHEAIHPALHRPAHLNQDRVQRNLGYLVGANWTLDNNGEYAADLYWRHGKQLIKAHLDEDVEPGGGLDYRGIAHKVKGEFGYVPKHMQLGGLWRNYFYRKAVVNDLVTAADEQAFVDQIADEEVRLAFVDSRFYVEEMWQMIPAGLTDTTNWSRIDSLAKAVCDYYDQNIWPIYEKLVENSVNEQTIVDMLTDLLGDGVQDGQVIVLTIDDLPDWLKQEIDGTVNGPSQDQNPASSGAQDNQPATEPTSKPNSGGIIIDQLSPEAKQTLKEKYNGLSEGKKQEYQDQAKKELGSAEDGINEELGMHASDPQISPKSNFKQTLRQPQDSQSEPGQALDSGQAPQPVDPEFKQKMEQYLNNTGEPLSSEEAYNLALEAAFDEIVSNPSDAALIEKQVAELSYLIKPTRRFKRVSSETGEEVDIDRALDRQTDERVLDIFTTEINPRKRKLAFVKIVDLSQSVSGEVCSQMTRGTAIDVTVATQLEIPIAVYGYKGKNQGAWVGRYKDFSQGLGEDEVPAEVKRILCRCPWMSVAAPPPQRHQPLLSGMC